ncbi:hypothetical protein CC86DRAFT_372097 [Ophiobolus disseminans]|uniref:Uncharacterized protein n=1 Tax=Ophiobolus disseminans TaxID=1469910 RepID=A0A6A6ZT30_9PLEO|nr:hypothetical protein CC86DRAFT_372097 [Ophiobolus disseminans]
MSSIAVAISLIGTALLAAGVSVATSRSVVRFRLRRFRYIVALGDQILAAGDTEPLTA